MLSHIDVRVLSIIVVGPKQYANAKTPNDAAVPLTAPEKHTRSIEINMPIPQKTTAYSQQVSLSVRHDQLLTDGNAASIEVEEYSQQGNHKET